MTRNLLAGTTALALALAPMTPSLTIAAAAEQRLAQAQGTDQGAEKPIEEQAEKAKGQERKAEQAEQPEQADEKAQAGEQPVDQSAEQAAGQDTGQDTGKGKSDEAPGKQKKAEREDAPAAAEGQVEAPAAAESTSAGQSTEASGQEMKAEEAAQEPQPETAAQGGAETGAEAAAQTAPVAPEPATSEPTAPEATATESSAQGRSDEAPGQQKKTGDGDTAGAAAAAEEQKPEPAPEPAPAATPEPAPAAATQQAEPAPGTAPEAVGGTTEATAPQPETVPAEAQAGQAEPKAAETGEPAAAAAEQEPTLDQTKGEQAQGTDQQQTQEPTQETAQEPAPPAAAAAAEGQTPAEPVTVTDEKVTAETTRTSDEEVEEARAERSKKGKDDDDLLKILGAAAGGLAGGLIIGSLLKDGGEVVENTGDRVIIERDGQYFVRKDETEMLRRPGSDVRTETFRDGSSRTIVEREDGTRVVTIRDQNGYVVRRSRILPDGREILLFDDTAEPSRESRFEQSELPPLYVETLPHARYVDYSRAGQTELRETLMARPVTDIDRSFTLRQVREHRELRDLVPGLDLDTITFDTGSSAITISQARKLDELGRAMEEILAENPDEVFLIEGHTDAVGSRISNLALSDRRAESVALALTEYYDIPPENLFTQGYGEEFLKVVTPAAERVNRRATVRRITPLLERSAALR